MVYGFFPIAGFPYKGAVKGTDAYWSHLVGERYAGVSATEEDEAGVRRDVEAVRQRVVLPAHFAERNLATTNRAQNTEYRQA